LERLTAFETDAATTATSDNIKPADADETIGGDDDHGDRQNNLSNEGSMDKVSSEEDTLDKELFRKTKTGLDG